MPFAIDDFGVGFSSIGYLQDMPVQIIKTDLSFSEGIDRDERSCALLCSITMMGQALGLDVVVEGIERASQLDHLREHVHAPYAQGYLMHRPMPLDQLLEVIEKNRALIASRPRPGRAAGRADAPDGAHRWPEPVSGAAASAPPPRRRRFPSTSGSHFIKDTCSIVQGSLRKRVERGDEALEVRRARWCP